MEIYKPKLNQYDADNETPNFETRKTSSRDIESMESRKRRKETEKSLNSNEIYN